MIDTGRFVLLGEDAGAVSLVPLHRRWRSTCPPELVSGPVDGAAVHPCP
ncbi:hypothetical protein [Actinomadura sp. NBRC 104412]|nr:hypothetical protein [Actinomadura sp. NBRC 104412]